MAKSTILEVRIGASCACYQLRKSWLTKYKERVAYDGHICCSESTELRSRRSRKRRSLSRVHPRGVRKELQTRRVGETRPCIRHNMIELLVKRWERRGQKGARREAVDRTGFTERRTSDDCVDLPHRRPRHDCYPLTRVAAFSTARRRSANVGSTRSMPLQSRAARLL